MSDAVLVTGASGFAGGHLLDLLVGDEHPVVAWRRPGSPSPPDGANVRWRAIDIRDAAAVRDAIEETPPAIIYHCAGAAHTAASWQDAAGTLETNVLGTHHLFEALRHSGVNSPVLVPGSALVYRPSSEALHEDAPLGPQSPYAASKLAQEMLAVRAAGEQGLPVFVARSFNHLGPRQDPSFSASSFARQIARIEAKRDPPVIHVGNLEARRDLTDVRDVVRAYREIVARGRAGRVYNVCSGRAFAVSEVLDRLVELACVDVEVRPDPGRFRPNDMPLLLGDPTRIEAEIGWRPEISIEQTLADLLAYWRKSEGL